MVVCPETVTLTVTVPAAWAGAFTVMSVPLTTVTVVPAAVPKVTVAPGRNPEPVRVTVLPPEVGPATGATFVRVGLVTEYV